MATAITTTGGIKLMALGESIKGFLHKAWQRQKNKSQPQHQMHTECLGFSCQSPGLKVIAYSAISSDQGEQQNEFTRVKFRRAIITKKILSTTFEWVRIAVKMQTLRGKVSGKNHCRRKRQ
jgi:hypothetical protein